MELNKILEGNCLDHLRSMPDDFLQCVVTSPPYYGLRSYKTEPQIWDGDENCTHTWNKIIVPPKGGRNVEGNAPLTGNDSYTQADTSNPRFGTESDVCQRCSAWRGELGLEPRFDCQRDRNADLEIRDDLTDVEKETLVRELLALGLIR